MQALPSDGPRAPSWVILVLFGVQVWLFFQVKDVWGWWKALGAFLVIALVAARATRARGLKAALFPWWAERWEGRRHWFQGALLLGGTLSLLFAWGPHPWLGVTTLVSLVKAAIR